MSIKQKLLNIAAAHPKLVTFGIGLGITMAITTTLGMLDNTPLAFATHHSGVHNTVTQSGGILKK